MSNAWFYDEGQDSKLEHDGTSRDVCVQMCIGLCRAASFFDEYIGDHAKAWECQDLADAVWHMLCQEERDRVSKALE
jgi:hypothetical protein